MAYDETKRNTWNSNSRNTFGSFSLKTKGNKIVHNKRLYTVSQLDAWSSIQSKEYEGRANGQYILIIIIPTLFQYVSEI